MDEKAQKLCYELREWFDLWWIKGNPDADTSKKVLQLFELLAQYREQIQQIAIALNLPPDASHLAQVAREARENAEKYFAELRELTSQSAKGKP